ncbi:hypothetical protein LMG28614_05038 [Paraburkholderia ultramafica]|uniref:Uncharacterized protein n=1 Tax=Paraburkholderia ultramafica TaxID=1544867 RepID=A0A6S7BR22_9BURK|nr:hypothetical protein LMG28614_05038 [Paraburkholderia ultramafica]
MAAPECVPGISTKGLGSGLVFEAAFCDLSESDKYRSLEVPLFSNDSGHLSSVENDYCESGLLIPEQMNLESAPYLLLLCDSLIPA